MKGDASSDVRHHSGRSATDLVGSARHHGYSNARQPQKFRPWQVCSGTGTKRQQVRHPGASADIVAARANAILDLPDGQPSHRLYGRRLARRSKYWQSAYY